MSKSKSNWENNVIIIAVIIVVIIIIYLVSAGRINLTTKIDKNEEESIEETKRKHARLKNHLEKQKALREKLAQRFWWIYFVTRLIFVVLWGLLVFILSKFHLAQNLGDFLNYFEAIFIGFIVLNFLAFGNLTNLNSFLENIKNRLENRVWGKYINIDDKIASNEEEINRLSDQIKKSK